MIRFSCPHCQREYVLADALAHLPLLCKGCGHQLTVPEPSPEPEPPLEFFAPHPPVAKKLAPPPPPEDEDDEPLFESETPDIDFNAPPPKEPRRSLSPTPPAPAPPKSAGNRKAIAVVVDVIVALLLVAVGVFLGELLARKSTREVFAGINGPKFPQPELLMWLGPPLLLVLVYTLLGSRQKTLGAWLKKRAG
ncbi:MAG TPA: hypothetical protein VMZ71_02950 [Gemmataceae bacterium]|nr:hypothetical protein [Gemmataceae bacterium]